MKTPKCPIALAVRRLFRPRIMLPRNLMVTKAKPSAKLYSRKNHATRHDH